jgi:hypothetical protein
LAACDTQRHPRNHLADCLPTSFVGPPWPAETVRIAGAAPDLTALPVGQALSAPPAAEGRLNRPRLKQQLRAVGTNVRARRIGRRDPEQQDSGIRVVGIGRDVTYDCLPRCFWLMLHQPFVTLGDPFQEFALGIPLPSRAS